MTEPPASRRARLPKRTEWTARGHLGPAVVILPHDVQDMKMPELGPENWVSRSIAAAPAAGGSASSQAPAPTTTPSPLRSATANPGRHEPWDLPGATSSMQEP